MGTFANHAQATAVVAILLTLRVTAQDPRWPDGQIGPSVCECRMGGSNACGVNGKTYVNKCWAKCLGGGVACSGRCPCESQALTRRLLGDLSSDDYEDALDNQLETSLCLLKCTLPKPFYCGKNNLTLQGTCPFQCLGVDIACSGKCPCP